MQTSVIKRIPKIACSILVVIIFEIFLFVLLSPFWFWTWWEILAFSLVSFGCVGEWIAHDNKKHERKEVYFIMSVAIGVTMEWFALFTHTIPDTLRQEETNLKLEKHVEELRKENNDLEALIQPRRIEKLSTFASILEKNPKVNVLISFVNEMEARKLSQTLWLLFWSAGWEPKYEPLEEGHASYDNVRVFSLPSDGLTGPADLFVKGLTERGIAAQLMRVAAPQLPTNTIKIMVGSKTGFNETKRLVLANRVAFETDIKKRTELQSELDILNKEHLEDLHKIFEFQNLK